MDKCRTCKHFRQFNYVFGCAKNKHTLFPNRSYADCKNYETNHDVINDILQKHRNEKVRRFFKTLSDDKS